MSQTTSTAPVTIPVITISQDGSASPPRLYEETLPPLPPLPPLSDDQLIQELDDLNSTTHELWPEDVGTTVDGVKYCLLKRERDWFGALLKRKDREILEEKYETHKSLVELYNTEYVLKDKEKLIVQLTKERDEAFVLLGANWLPTQCRLMDNKLGGRETAPQMKDQ